MTAYTDTSLSIVTTATIGAYVLVPKSITIEGRRDVPVVTAITSNDLPTVIITED